MVFLVYNTNNKKRRIRVVFLYLGNLFGSYVGERGRIRNSRTDDEYVGLRVRETPDPIVASVPGVSKILMWCSTLLNLVGIIYGLVALSAEIYHNPRYF